ncbi:MAG: DUF2085 domain-containing protein [Candidatus Nanosalina sp.]
MATSEELRKGLKRTSRYVLSHHRPEDFNRCYHLSFLNYSFHLCARCSGIFPGIFTGLVFGFWLNLQVSLPLITVSGIPTLIEKYFTGVKEYEGFNSVRSLTGFALGFGYIQGILFFLDNPGNVFLYAVAVFYLVSAGLLLKADGKTVST